MVNMSAAGARLAVALVLLCTGRMLVLALHHLYMIAATTGSSRGSSRYSSRGRSSHYSTRLLPPPTCRYSRDKARLGDTLEVIKFLCKDFWQALFKKQVDNLKTNHRVSFELLVPCCIPQIVVMLCCSSCAAVELLQVLRTWVRATVWKPDASTCMGSHANTLHITYARTFKCPTQTHSLRASTCCKTTASGGCCG